MKNPSHEPTAFDRVDVQQQRARGNAKWAMFPEHLGAFIAEMDFDTPAVIHDAIAQRVQHLNFGYPTQQAHQGLRQATHQWYRDRYDHAVPVDQVFLATDVLSSLSMSIEFLTQKTDKLIVLTPAYMPFVHLHETSEREIIEIPMLLTENSWDIDFDGLDAAFRAGGKMLVLANPHNPIGRSYTRAELTEISRIVATHDGVVFSDELHAPLTFAQIQHVPYASVNQQANNHTVTAFAASKAWNIPGLKCAQILIGNPQWAALWSKRAKLLADGASTFGILANTTAYQQAPDFPSQVMEYLSGNVDLITQSLNRDLPTAKFRAPEATYLAWIDLSQYATDTHISETWASIIQSRAGVVVTPGESCGRAGAGAIRLNFATSRSMLTEILAKISLAVQHRSSAQQQN